MICTMYQLDSAVGMLEISGRFDVLHLRQVQQKFDALLTVGVRYIILDLAAVTFVDSSALTLIVRAMQRCRERNGELLLCGLCPPVRIIFELTRIEKAFRVFDSEVAAQAALIGC